MQKIPFSLLQSVILPASKKGLTVQITTATLRILVFTLLTYFEY